MWVHTKQSQEKITPVMAINYLKEGNQRFLNNLKLHRNLLHQVNLTSEGQYPFATILSCIDSRTSAELIFDQGLGDIFSIRIAGNILNDDILGSMEYACKVANSKLIVILGHTKCGAITSACNKTTLGHFTNLLEKINPAIQIEKNSFNNHDINTIDFINNVSIHNVKLIIEKIRDKSPILKEMEKAEEIAIIGALYNIETGEVSFFEEEIN